MTEEVAKQIAAFDTYQKILSDGFDKALDASQTEQASHYKLTLLRVKTTPLSIKTSANFELILGPVEESNRADKNVSDNRIWNDTVAMTEALGSRIGKVLNECMDSDFYHSVKTSSFCSAGGSWGRIDSFKADEDTSLAKGDKYPRFKVTARTMCGDAACIPSDKTLNGELNIGALRVSDDTAGHGTEHPILDSDISTIKLKAMASGAETEEQQVQQAIASSLQDLRTEECGSSGSASFKRPLQQSNSDEDLSLPGEKGKNPRYK